MDPEAMRRCMSFGFSDKKSKLAIGQCMHHGILSATILVFSFVFIFRFDSVLQMEMALRPVL